MRRLKPHLGVYGLGMYTIGFTRGGALVGQFRRVLARQLGGFFDSSIYPNTRMHYGRIGGMRVQWKCDSVPSPNCTYGWREGGFAYVVILVYGSGPGAGLRRSDLTALIANTRVP